MVKMPQKTLKREKIYCSEDQTLVLNWGWLLPAIGASNCQALGHRPSEQSGTSRYERHQVAQVGT